MKIAIIAPPYPLEEAPSPPLGVCYVAAACEKAGAAVEIFDYIVRKYTAGNLREEIQRFSPDVIGITAVTMNCKKAVQILKQAKEIKPGIITLFGGPHATFDYENILSQNPCVDLILRGEAEQTIQELVPLLLSPKRWTAVSGLAFRKGGKIHVTQDRGLIRDLDTLPLPSRHLLPISRYQALGFPVSIITSRGCPNKCIFCLGRKMVGFKVRHRSTGLVMDEIEEILSYGFDIINIADDLFTANKKRVMAFCREIKKRGLKFKWSVFARVNTVTLEMLSEMKRAGCHSISFGIESGNAGMLKGVNKGITLNQAIKAVNACKKAGISAHASFIAGLPGESFETLKDSEKLIDELDIAYGYHFLAPFPGTIVRENVNRYDLEILSDDWDLYDANHVVVRTSHLSPKDIEEFVEQAYLPHVNEWEALKERFRNNDVTGNEYLQVAGHHRMTLIYKILSGNLIERYAVQPGDFDMALTGLSKAIARDAGQKQDFTRFHLHDLIKKRLIRFTKKNGNIFFFWAHNSETPVFHGKAA